MSFNPVYFIADASLLKLCVSHTEGISGFPSKIFIQLDPMLIPTIRLQVYSPYSRTVNLRVGTAVFLLVLRTKPAVSQHFYQYINSAHLYEYKYVPLDLTNI